MMCIFIPSWIIRKSFKNGGFEEDDDAVAAATVEDTPPSSPARITKRLYSQICYLDWGIEKTSRSCCGGHQKSRRLTDGKMSYCSFSVLLLIGIVLSVTHAALPPTEQKVYTQVTVESPSQGHHYTLNLQDQAQSRQGTFQIKKIKFV